MTPRIRLHPFIHSIAWYSVTVFVLTGTGVYGKEPLHWSGYQWHIRDTQGKPSGPGPNVFSNDPHSVFVDDEGDLHLRIRQNTQGVWTASEVRLTKPLGYGTYQWEVSTRYDQLPKNVVVGLFTYLGPQEVADQQGGAVGNGLPDTPHEIDIEFTGAWGDANLYFTTHDPDIPSPGERFRTSLRQPKTTHRFRWTPNRIEWESFRGHVTEDTAPHQRITESSNDQDDSRPAVFNYAGPVIPKAGQEVPIINFWLFGASPSTEGPTDGRAQELIIHSFRYTPLPSQQP